MGINETINNNQEDSKQKICFKYYLLSTRT